MINQIAKETGSNSFSPSPSILLIALAVLILIPKPAFSCGACAFALIDYYLPPVLFYCHLISFWVISLGIFATIKKRKIWKQNPFVMSLLAVLLSYVVGFASFGPVGYLFILYGSFVFIYKNIPKEERKPVIFINAFFIASAFALTIYGQYVRTQRSPADFILAWNGTVPSVHKIKDLAKTSNTGLPQLRYLLENGESSVLQQTARVMVGIAEPEKDIPLLLDALKRARQRKDRNWVIEQLEESIVQISGIEMPENFTVEEFEKKWKEKKMMGEGGQVCVTAGSGL